MNNFLLNIKYFFKVPSEIKKTDRKNIKTQKHKLKQAQDNAFYANYKGIIRQRDIQDCSIEIYPQIQFDEQLIFLIEDICKYSIYKCSFFNECSKNLEQKKNCTKQKIEEDIKIREKQLEIEIQKLELLKKQRLDRVR